MIAWLTEKIIISYCYSTSTFLLLSIVFKSIRKRYDLFLNLSNLIALVFLTINLILTGIYAIECRIEQVEHLSKVKTEGYDFYYTKSCFTVFIWTLIFAFLIQIPFLYKRHRQKKVLTIISILSLLVILNLERVVIFITSLYRDYFPSSWSVYYDKTDRLWTIAFSTLYFIICWTIPLIIKPRKTE
jgi:hypothetical protein